MRSRIKGAGIVDVVPTVLIRASLCVDFHADLRVDAAAVPTSVCER
jgi:hypothetical protein